jgi:hypothetical protein
MMNPFPEHLPQSRLIAPFFAPELNKRKQVKVLSQRMTADQTLTHGTAHTSYPSP